LFGRVTDTAEGVRKLRNHASFDVLSVVYSYICAVTVTGFPSTTLITMLSRYALLAATTLRVLRVDLPMTVTDDLSDRLLSSPYLTSCCDRAYTNRQ
jgi:hypothetical protein